jgi:UDP:flavonoid glycosyltransferase YjiC (YdhE family)
MHWLGPCPESPVFEHTPPHYEPDKKHVFVSLGTQIPWAKERAEKVFREVAAQLPEYVFHFVLGNTKMKEPRKENNLHFYGYMPYTSEAFQNYNVLVNHGGIGVMYASMTSGVPQLIWPQDFDQHDNAAQIDYHKAGLRTNGKVKDIVEKIKQLVENEAYRKRAQEFQQIVNRYQPGKSFVELLEKRFP